MKKVLFIMFIMFGFVTLTWCLSDSEVVENVNVTWDVVNVEEDKSLEVDVETGEVIEKVEEDVVADVKKESDAEEVNADDEELIDDLMKEIDDALQEEMK